jgi:hypothetical protein
MWFNQKSAEFNHFSDKLSKPVDSVLDNLEIVSRVETSSKGVKSNN